MKKKPTKKIHGRRFIGCFIICFLILNFSSFVYAGPFDIDYAKNLCSSLAVQPGMAVNGTVSIWALA